MNALIIVDLQNDFCPGGTLAVPGGDAIVGRINDLQGRFDLVVATQDWHPENHGSFARTHGKPPGEIADLDGVPQILWPTHCVAGTNGAELVDALETSHLSRVFRKGTNPSVDSYSGFFDNRRRQSTGLAEYLRSKGVDQVYIVGLAMDYCVKHTALDARALGFETVVVSDACRGVDLRPGDVERALAEMRAAGARIVTTADVPPPPRP